jgi:hypothetical protein
MNFLKRLFSSKASIARAEAEAKTKKIRAAAEAETEKIRAIAEAEKEKIRVEKEFIEKCRRDELAEAKRKEQAEMARLEAEAVANGDLLPREIETGAEAVPVDGTFRAVGLTWQLEPAPGALGFDLAGRYAASLRLARRAWRLPTISELDALNKAKRSSPAILNHPGMCDGWYWSATPHPEGNTWCVNFHDGSNAGNVRGRAIEVRCVVRDSGAINALQTGTQEEGSLRKSSGASEATNQNQRTFRASGLVWQREPAGWKMSWNDAKSYAARLRIAGGGWRLPTVLELKALYEEKQSSPEIAAHPGMSKSCYWSVSEDPHDPLEYALTVYFKNGEVSPIQNTSSYAVRCVRG